MAEGLEETEMTARWLAAERVRRMGQRRNVSAGIVDDVHSMEPWVVELSASSQTLDGGSPELFAFCPLHQRPASILGTVGVEIGNVVVSPVCPGLLYGVYHPGGHEYVEAWVDDHQVSLAMLLDREGTRLLQEINEDDFVAAPGVTSPVPQGEELELLKAHLRGRADDLRRMAEQVRDGEVPVPGKVT